MEIAVALATCDGERHLGEQLASLAAQERLPDRLVAVDDASSDATVALLRGFAADAPFPVDVVPVEDRLGPAAAFGLALEGARGADLVVLCDQDDRWRPDRIARTEARLRRDPAIWLVLGDAGLLDPDGRELPWTRWGLAGVDDDVRRALRVDPLGVLADHYLVPGCTAAVTGALLDAALPLPPELDGEGGIRFLHDLWLVTLAAGARRVGLLDGPVLDQRVHPGQAVGVPDERWRRRLPSRARWVLDGARTRRDLAHRRSRAALLRVASDRLAARGGRTGAVAAHELATAARMLEVRGTLDPVRRRRLGPVVDQLRAGAYGRFAEGWPSALDDVLRP